MTLPVQVTVQRGQPFTAVLEVESGDPTGFTVTAKLKPTAGQAMPEDTVAVAATFAVSFVAAVAGQAAHWLLTLTDLVTEALAPGQYVFDARLKLAGETAVITSPVFLRVLERVTPA